MTDTAKPAPFVSSPPKPFGSVPIMALAANGAPWSRMAPVFDREGMGGESGGQGGSYSLPDDVPLAREDGDDFDGEGGEGDDDLDGDDSANGGNDSAPGGEGNDSLSGDDENDPAELRRRLNGLQRVNQRERNRRIALERQMAEGSNREGGGQRQERQESREEVAIDPEVDPIGAFKQMSAKVAAYEANERARTANAETAQRQDAMFRQIEEAMGEYEADYRETRPDYDAAATHFGQSRLREMMAFGHPQQQAQAMLRQELATMVATAIRARRDPAELIYKAAADRGYKAKGPAPKPGERQGQEPGKQSALERVRAGQRLGSPLSRAGKAGRGVDPSVLARVDIRDRKGGEAFDKGFEEYERAERARERGGR